MKLKSFLGKYLISIGIILSLIAFLIAYTLYPGGTIKDPNSIGYSMTENYISNLMEYKALNGLDNPARPWGILATVLMGLTSGFAFVRFSKKIDLKKYSLVIKFLGFALIVITSLIAIPNLHDLMVTIGSILTLLLYFYVTVLLVKSKLQFLKVLSVTFLICFYGAAFMYFTRTALEYMPTIQKVIHLLQIVFILGIEYYSSKTDFDQNQKLTVYYDH